MIPTPDYLKQYATAQKQKGNRLSFKIKCTCGCETFTVYEKDYTDEEKQLISEYESKIPKIGMHTIYGGVDADGKPYSYIKRFGIFKQYIKFPPIPVFMDFEIVKAVCSQCKKDVVLFDSRYYGYDGITSDNAEAKNYIPRFKEKDHKIYNIVINIWNMLSLEEFNNELNANCSLEEYSNSFGGISALGIDEKRNRIMLFDFETG